MDKASELTNEQIEAFKRAQVAQAAQEIEAVCQRYHVAMLAQPVLLPDGRLSAQVRLEYRDGG